MKQILYFSIALLLLVSCKKEDVKTKLNSNVDIGTDETIEECIEYKIAYVTNVDTPITGTVNTPVQIDVTYGLMSGCGNFEKFIENVNGNTNTIQVETKYVGCSCTMVDPIVTTPFVFVKNTPGIYTIKFKSGVSEFIEVDLEIIE